MKIILVHNYARSGGTLLTKVINASQNLCALSEIHPLISVGNNNVNISCEMAIREQAYSWHNLELSGSSISELINDFCLKCSRANKIPVFRNWSFQDFSPTIHNRFDPSLECDIKQYLPCSSSNSIVEFAFIRDAIDVCISRSQEPEKFATEYINYLQYLKKHNIKIFKYEDLTSNPIVFLSNLSQYLGVPTLQPIIDKHRATGDLQLGFSSRGQRANGIKSQPRKIVSPYFRAKIFKSKTLARCNILMAYPVKYSDRERESFSSFIVNAFFKALKRIQRIIKNPFLFT